MAYSDAPIDDLTEGESDGLDRRRAVRALHRLLTDPQLKTPLTLGVFGGWGMGKTSMMRSLSRTLGCPDSRRLVVWFDAWIYARQEEALWRALLLQVIAALRRLTEPPDGSKLQGECYDQARKAYQEFWSAGSAEADTARARLDEASVSLYRSLTRKDSAGVRVNWWGALPLAADVLVTAVTAGLNQQVARAVGGDKAEGGITAALAKWVKGGDTKEAVRLIERQYTEHYVERVASLEQFQQTFRAVLKAFGIGNQAPQRRLYVFVDDLDRCLPEDAVAALEAIKLFLDLEGCVFVLGMDRQVVEQGIAVRYAPLKEAGFDARAYLDKIIQIPFTLPPLGAGQIGRYLDSLIAGTPEFEDCRDLIIAVAPPNPRTLKRVLNALLVVRYLDEAEHHPAGVSVHIPPWQPPNSQEKPARRPAPNEGGCERLPACSTAPGHDRDRWRSLAKLVLLQTCFDQLWQKIVTDATLLGRLENAAEGVAIDGLPAGSTTDPRLKALFKLSPKFAPLPPERLNALLTMTRTTG